MRPNLTWAALTLAAIPLIGSAGLLRAEEPAADSKPAVLIIHLPASGELTINGVKSKQTGDRRTFDTPPLEAGKQFVYRIKAAWKDDEGKETTHVARAVVRAGQTTDLDLVSCKVSYCETEVKEKPKAPEKKVATTLKPPSTPEKRSPGSFKLELASARLFLKPGETKSLSIRLHRDHFDKPVKLNFMGVPAKVAVEDVTLAGDQTRATVLVSAADDAPAHDGSLQVTALGGDVRRQGELRLVVDRPAPAKVEAPAPREKPAQIIPVAEVALEMPETLRLQPGGKKLLPIKVRRTGFQGPVTVTFENLPSGVQLTDTTIGAKKDKVYVAASASAEVEEKEWQAHVKAAAGATRQDSTLRIKISK